MVLQRQPCEKRLELLRAGLSQFQLAAIDPLQGQDGNASMKVFLRQRKKIMDRQRVEKAREERKGGGTSSWR